MKTLTEQHLKAVKELIAKYRSITLKDIEFYRPQCLPNSRIDWKGNTLYSGIANILTGYGSTTTCSLCISTNTKSKDCIYFNFSDFKEDGGAYCRYGNPELVRTYYNIGNAESPQELLDAFRERANLLEKYLTEYLWTKKDDEALYKIIKETTTKFIGDMPYRFAFIHLLIKSLNSLTVEKILEGKIDDCIRETQEKIFTNPTLLCGRELNFLCELRDNIYRGLKMDYLKERNIIYWKKLRYYEPKMSIEDNNKLEHSIMEDNNIDTSPSETLPDHFKKVLWGCKRPPVGITPRFLWEEKRIKEIREAIKRYQEAGISYDDTWLGELYDLENREENEKKTKKLVDLVSSMCVLRSVGRNVLDVAYELLSIEKERGELIKSILNKTKK